MRIYIYANKTNIFVDSGLLYYVSVVTRTNYAPGTRTLTYIYTRIRSRTFSIPNNKETRLLVSTEVHSRVRSWSRWRNVHDISTSWPARQAVLPSLSSRFITPPRSRPFHFPLIEAFEVHSTRGGFVSFALQQHPRLFISSILGTTYTFRVLFILFYFSFFLHPLVLLHGEKIE